MWNSSLRFDKDGNTKGLGKGRLKMRRDETLLEENDSSSENIIKMRLRRINNGKRK